MNRLRSLLNVKLLIAAGSLAVGVTAYVSTLPHADAFIGPGVCTYYSSNKYKTAVGARGTGCCGAVINWGVTSPYVKCETVYCTDQICPN